MYTIKAHSKLMGNDGLLISGIGVNWIVMEKYMKSNIFLILNIMINFKQIRDLNVKIKEIMSGRRHRNEIFMNSTREIIVNLIKKKTFA